MDKEGFIFESDPEGKPLDEDRAKSDTETLRWTNDFTKWDISKTDITGDEELEGAVLEVRNDKNELIETWISGKSPHRIERLIPGKYLLTEKTAPAGYVTASTISFEVTEDWKVHSVVMIDQVTRVRISKLDITDQREVPGAHLEILDEKGELDRTKLSDIVFADRVELSVLNGIVHPKVKEEIQKKIAREERKSTNLMLIEGALLIEDHYEEICDELWYVYVEDSIRRKRLKYSRGYEDCKVDQIFEAQLPKDLFMRHCDRVIDNSGQFEETKIQLNQIIEDL